MGWPAEDVWSRGVVKGPGGGWRVRLGAWPVAVLDWEGVDVVAGVGERVRVFGADRGSGTIWVLAFAAVIWVGGIAAVAIGGVRGARHRVDAAADLAALAGAARLAAGGEGACGSAKRIAVESGARLVRCQVKGDVVEVSVTVDVVVPMGLGAVQVLSRARAGPVKQEGVPLRDTARCTECQ
ncbi:Rv3654c family TadE-like protein [Actinomadura sp. 3N407]|uniref:Rv3654c family TadE-like protein n=1 Tax=Actinomadura sp. 3N407 TaxID=3457423 RepID=UPI003FCDCCE2